MAASQLSPIVDSPRRRSRLRASERESARERERAAERRGAAQGGGACAGTGGAGARGRGGRGAPTRADEAPSRRDSDQPPPGECLARVEETPRSDSGRSEPQESASASPHGALVAGKGEDAAQKSYLIQRMASGLAPQHSPSAPSLPRRDRPRDPPLLEASQQSPLGTLPRRPPHRSTRSRQCPRRRCSSPWQGTPWRAHARAS